MIAAQNVHDLMSHQLLDVCAGGLEVFAGIKFVRMLVEELSDGARHGQAQIRVDIDLAYGHAGGLAELVLRHANGTRHIAAILVDHLHILLGHGGRAVGANKQGINEKEIDLAIVLKLKEIFDNSDQNIGVYYTRTDDSNPTFDQRVQLANKSDADLFISIHNNSTRSGRMSGTSGTQVMYDETSEASRQFAQICLEEVTGRIGSRDKGLVEGDSIYIIRTSEVPVALIEVGFMTNKDELEKLNSDAYQRETAEGVYQAVLRAFEEGY